MDDINRVARLMVDAEPASDLDARIRARLDEVAPARARGNWGSWRLAAGLAAAAALVALVVLRSGGPEVLQSGNASIIAQSAAVTWTGVPASRPAVSMDSRTSGPQDPRTTPSAVQSTLSAEELAWMERRIPALDPVVALEMDQLAMKSIQPEPLAIPPLIMTALPTDGGTTERRER